MALERLPHVNRGDNRHIITSENRKNTFTEKVLLVVSMILVLVTFPLSLFFCLIVLKEYERAVVFRLGRLRKGGARGPGLVFVLPCIDDFINIDMRITSFEVPPQEILTKDSVTTRVDAVVYFRIQDPLKAVIQIESVGEATQLLAQTTLRNICGAQALMDILAAKDRLSKTIAKILDEGTEPWGVKVERVEIKDVRLPITLHRAMAAEAEASREAKAKIVAAEGELRASKALKEASDIILENPLSLQLRYLQTLVTISTEKNSTIVFPFPIDMMTFVKKSS